jgi:hypothetical protein
VNEGHEIEIQDGVLHAGLKVPNKVVPGNEDLVIRQFANIRYKNESTSTVHYALVSLWSSPVLLDENKLKVDVKLL